MATRKGTFSGANVFLSRNLVPPEVFDALHDALRLNGAQVFLCCDPSRNSPDDYHVISSPDHEKFEDLKSKGCNLIGPQCILSCAKEHRILPIQGYTCCLAMDGVKVLVSGFERDEKVKIEKLVTAMGGGLHAKASLDVNFVIVKNVLAAKYKILVLHHSYLPLFFLTRHIRAFEVNHAKEWAQNFLKKPIVNASWLYQCWIEHRVVPQEPYRILPFTGLTICVTRIPADERKEMERMILQNGGHYSSDLTKKCTHLVSDAPVGDKYMVARRWGHIHLVTRKWVDQSIAKRACLDEGCYPVRITSISCNDMKDPQKEQHYLDMSNVTSQPAIPPTVIDDLEATLSQNISSSFSDATKINNEGTDVPTVLTNDENKFECRVAEDSEEEDNDLYLSNCRILVVGFEEKGLSQLVTMIRKGGGTRHMLLSERLTHIIVGAPSEIEKKEVRRLAAWGVISVVRATWLEECDRAKKEISVSPRHVVSELLISKDSMCFNMEPSPDVFHIKKLKSFTSVPRVPMDQASDDNKSEAELPLEKRRVDVETKSRCNLQLNSATLKGQNSRISIPFKGKSFCFSTSFPVDRRAQIIEWVRQGGGVVVDDQRKMNAHFIVERHGLLQIPAVPSQLVVSTHWIRSSLEEGCMQDIGSHILYSPLRCHIPLPGFERLRFCVSQYEPKDRLLLRNLCFTLGAKFTERLTKRVTHLLCKFSSGSKYVAACNWGIQSVTADWITECITQDTVVGLDPFRPKPATAQDREAGLCTQSQHPTQAAHMVSGYVPSQSLSESQGAVDIQKQHIGVTSDKFCVETEHPSVHGKRSMSSECDIGDASKKNRRQEDLVGGSNGDTGVVEVTGVVEAIDCLIAQSNEIHDMKSPGRSCDQIIFSPGHSILGHNHANSHSFGISSHWLGRTQKQDSIPNPASHNVNMGTYDAFSETQTESQVVGYEEDLSGRQKIIDRVRSQTMTSTPDK